MEKKEEKIKKRIEKQEEEKIKQIFEKKGEKPEPKLITFDPEIGIGQILTSGKTVHGNDTKFKSSFQIDDSIIVDHPHSKQIEERQICAILSDKSILLKEPFSADIINFQSYKILKKPKLEEVQDTLEEVFEKKYIGLTKKIQKDKGNTLEYRQKTGMWGYKVIKEKLDDKLGREDILDLRSKKNRDKFCWI